MPTISIIMTSYNYAQYISMAINSVIFQTYQDWELIIIDDGSKDNSLDVINSYINHYPDKISSYTHPNNENLGLINSLELGISKAKGVFIAFLESDDYWERDYLDLKLLTFEKHPELALVYSNFNVISDEKELPHTIIDYSQFINYIGSQSDSKPFQALNFVLVKNILASFSNIVVKKEIVENIHFNKDYEFWSDWWLQIFVSIKGDFYYIPNRLWNWRIHNASHHNYRSQSNQPLYSGKEFRRDVLELLNNNEQANKNFNNISGYKLYKKSLIISIGFMFKYPKSFYRTIFDVLLKRKKIV